MNRQRLIPTLPRKDGMPRLGVSDQPGRAGDSISDQSFGLVQLKDFSEDHSTSLATSMLDVVALHGLNGDAIKSWKSDNTIWFKDILPSLVPEVDMRISSFGYHSEILLGPSKDSMLDFELQLLAALSTLRKSLDSAKKTHTIGIPILFLCHSLGGILFKKVWRLAADRPKQYGDIAWSVRCVMFFGTPHRGSDNANLAGIIFQVLKTTIPGGNFRADLIQNLKRSSEELAEIAMTSVEQLESLKIISIYERKRLGPFGMIVDRESALLNIPNEFPIPVDADHRDICRFSNRNDSRFSTVLFAAANLIRSVIVRTQPRFYTQCLESLYFPELQERRLRVTEPYEDTFAWIWKHNKFMQWKESSTSELLWLHGKPASGKSTIMNFVRKGLEDHLRQSDKDISNSPKRYVTVDFFYSAQVGAGERQRGHVWMLKSILYQILQNVPALWTDFCNFLEPSFDITDGKGEYPQLSTDFAYYFESKMRHLEDLERLLTSIGSRYRAHNKLVLYILVDAMDESDREQRLKIVSSLLKISNYPESWPITFKVIVASRPDSLTGAISRKCVSILLEEETTSDILTVVDRELDRIATDVPSLEQESFGFLRKELLQKSQGVFLWVKLVLLQLEQMANEEGCTIREVEELLQSIPGGLEQLYRRMASVLAIQTPQQKQEMKTMLEWTTYSQRPITPSEMRDIAAAATCTSERLTVAEMTRNRVATVDEMKRRIVTRCGNFLEIKDISNSETGTPIAIIQFIHITALEYLVSQPVAADVYLGSQKDAEFSMMRLSEKYVDFLTFSMPPWDVLAGTDQKFSIDALRIANIQPMINFLRRFRPTLLNLTLGEAANARGIRHREDSSTVKDRQRFSAARSRGNLSFGALCLASAVQNDAHALLLLRDAMVLDLLVSNNSAFLVSVTNDNPITGDSKVSIRIGLPSTESGTMPDAGPLIGVLEVISKFADLQACRTLHDSGFFSEELIGPADTSAHANLLVRAAEKGNENLARILLSREFLGGESISEIPRDHFGRNVISTALDYGHVGFVRALLAENLTDRFDFRDLADTPGYRTALSRACEQGLSDVARLLWPRYSKSWLSHGPESRVDLCELARGRGYIDIAQMFESGPRDELES